MSLLKIQAAVEEKNKSILAGVQSAQSVFQGFDNEFAKDENQTRVDIFNEKISKFGVFYNPSQKDKSIAGCTACTSITDIVVRLCEKYGCIANNFVNRVTSDSCDKLLVEVVTLLQDDLDLAIDSTDQDISGTSADNSCVTIPMRDLSVYVKISKRALCSCTGLDKILLATERMALKLAKAYDKAILYGRLNTATGTYVALPNFDSIDLLIPAEQKLTANGEVQLYKKIIQAITAIQDYTGCDDDQIKIVIRPGVKTRMTGWLDNNDRPVWSELRGEGISCENLRVACKEAMTCQSLTQKTVVDNTDPANPVTVVTTDIFVGYTPHYTFGTYEFPDIEIKEDPNSQVHYKMGKVSSYAGKLHDPKSFYKITATF